MLLDINLCLDVLDICLGGHTEDYTVFRKFWLNRLKEFCYDILIKKLFSFKDYILNCNLNCEESGSF